MDEVMIYSMGEVIGDGLIKLPFVAGLRDAWPNRRIVWCAAKGDTVYAGPLKGVVEGLIDEVLVAPPLGASALDHLRPVRPFGGRRFGLVLDTQSNVLRSLYARRAVRGRFISPSADFGLSDFKPAPDARRPDTMLGRLAELLALANGRPVPLRPIGLTQARALEAARALLPDGPTYVGLAPGAGGQDKRWPLDRYLALATQIEAAGWTPVLFFGPDEAEDAARARVALPQALIPERERTDAFQDVRGPLLVIALATRLTAAVANDAGPGHMLAAGGTALLSLQKLRDWSVKFRPTARRLELLVAEDFGTGMGALPLSVVRDRLWALMAEEARPT